jgi:hypothetical protein
MTTLVATARARSRPTVSADVLTLAGLAVFAAALVAITWGTWGDLDNDTGHDFVAGLRVANGELPYVDFPYWYGPLAPALLGLAAWLGGGSIAAFVGLGFVIAAAIVLGGYALARMHAGPVAAALATAITIPVALAPNQFSFVLPHTSAATLGVLTALGVLLALGAAANPDTRRRWLVAAGACAGLSALTKPEFAIAALAAVAVWLVLAARGGEGGWRDAALLGAPALAIPAAVYGAFLTAVPARTLLFDNLYPSDFLAEAGSTMLRARAPLSAASIVELGGRLVLYAAGAAALVAVAHLLASPGRRQRIALAACAGVGAVAVAASLANPEALRHGLQFVWGWIPAGAVAAAAVVLVRLRRRGAGERRVARTELAVLVALAAFAATTYAGFFLYAPHAQTAVYAVPLAAAFVARLHLVELARSRQAYALGIAWLAFLVVAGVGLTLKDARAEAAAVAGPAGLLRESPDKARAYGAAVNWIETRTRPGEPVLLAPQMTWLYAASGRTNPLPDISLLPGALGDADGERAAIAQLERAQVRVAVIDRRPFPGFGHTAFGRSYQPVLGAWIERNFVRAATAAGGPAGPALELWVRRTP